MAGIVDIRFDFQKHVWRAQPRFAFDRESMLNGAPSAEGTSPQSALYALCDLLPLQMANDLQRYCPQRIYRSPEYIYMDDKCIEMDGHCPTREEWAIRRRAYMVQRSIRNRV